MHPIRPPGPCLSGLTVLAAVLALPGCANPTTPRLDQYFGDATRIALASQVAHPDAASADPVAGMDGAAALGALTRYQKSFAEPAPPSAGFVIGVSGASGAK